VFDIDSMPPARTTSASPVSIAEQASWIAFIPEAQAMFTVIAGRSSGIPAWWATCRPGFVPQPA